MAISPRKLAANQQNARRSTGPRTPAGKARVRHNALKHGLLAKEVIVPLGDEYEKRAEFYLLLDDLCQHYAPVGPIEAMLVDRIAVAYWRLRRATRAEVGELIVEIDKAPGFEAVPFLSGVAARLRKQVEAADPNFDFGTWRTSAGTGRRSRPTSTTCALTSGSRGCSRRWRRRSKSAQSASTRNLS